jgi:hypothetical protein
MAAMVKALNESAQKAAALEDQHGGDHPAVQKAKKDVDARENRLAEQAALLSQRFVLRWKADGTGPLLVPRDTSDLRETVDRLRARSDAEAAAVRALREQSRGQSRGEVDDPMMLRARAEQLIVLEKALREAEEMLAQAEQDLKAAKAVDRKPTIEDWVRVDETMAKHLQMRNELQLRIESLEAQLGPNHPAILNAKKDLAAREESMQAAADKLAGQFVIRWKADGTGGLLIPRDLTNLTQSVDRMRALYERETKKVEQLWTAAAEAAAKREEMGSKKARAAEAATQRPAGGRGE